MKTIWGIIIIFCISVCYAKEKNIITQDPFISYYPHLKENICRKKSFDIRWVSHLNKQQQIKEWESYKNVCSKDGSYQLILSEMYLYSGNHKNREAEKLLVNSIKNADYDTRYHKALLVEVYVSLYKLEEALQLAKSMVKDYPNFYGGYQGLAVYFLNQKDWEKAKFYLDTAVLLNNQSPVLYRLLTVASYELRDDEKTHQFYEQALSLNAATTFADKHSSLRMIAVFILEKNFQAAKQLLDNLLKFNPEVKDDYRFANLRLQCHEGLSDSAKK